MKANETRPHWLTILACTICFAVGGNTIAFAPASLFVIPLTHELGWTRTQFFAGLSMATMIAALVLPFVGQIVDRWGPRAAIVPGILAFGASVAALSQLQGSWIVYLAIMAILGVAVMLHGPLPYSRVAVGAAGTRRGLALAVAISGSTIGFIFIPQLVSFLITHYGWRIAELWLGAIVVIVALPPALLFIGRRPNDGTAIAAAKAARSPFPWRELRSPVFWVLSSALLLNSIAVNAFVAHVGEIVVGHGLPITVGALAVSISGLGSAVARLASGWMLDRVGSPQIGQIWFGLAVIGFLVAASGTSTPSLVIAAALIGATLGAEVGIVAYFTSRFFPAAEYGRIYGLLYAFFMAGVSLGPLVFAVIYDAVGSYGPALVAMGVAQLLSCLILTRVGPYRYQLDGTPMPGQPRASAAPTRLDAVNG